jgi:hypothetical protein
MTNKANGKKDRDQTLIEYLAYEEGCSIAAISEYKADRHRRAAEYLGIQTAEKIEALGCAAIGSAAVVGAIMAGLLPIAIAGMVIAPMAGVAFMGRQKGELLAAKEQEFLRLNSHMLDYMAAMERQGLARTLDLADIYVQIFAERCHAGNLVVTPDIFKAALANHANSQIGASAGVTAFGAAMGSGVAMDAPKALSPVLPEAEPEPEPVVEVAYRFSPETMMGAEVAYPQVTAPQASHQAEEAQAAHPQQEQNRFIDVLMDNPYQSRAIIAGQRTGKTYGAAVATYILAQGGSEIFYINLFDHGQGNREAFSHARSVIGDLDKLSSDAGADLVAESISIIKQFQQSSDAILVVDEWMILGSENRDTPGIDHLWRLLGDETSRLCSNGIGNGRAIWGIAPFFKASQLRRDAKLLKECSPLVLSITPGHSVPWTNPRSGKVTQVKAQPQIIGDVLTNWPGCFITNPTDEQSRQWRREGVERIYWNQGQWHPMGSCPSLPKRQNHSSVGGDTTPPARSFAQGVATLIKEPTIAVRTEVANALITLIREKGKSECLSQVKQLKSIGQEQAAFKVMIEALEAASKTAFCAGFGITGGAKFQTFGQVYDWAMGDLS